MQLRDRVPAEMNLSDGRYWFFSTNKQQGIPPLCLGGVQALLKYRLDARVHAFYTFTFMANPAGRLTFRVDEYGQEVVSSENRRAYTSRDQDSFLSELTDETGGRFDMDVQPL